MASAEPMASAEQVAAHEAKLGHGKLAEEWVVSHFQISSSHQPSPLSLALPRGGGRGPGLEHLPPLSWRERARPGPRIRSGAGFDPGGWGEGETGAERPNAQPVWGT